MKTYWDLSEEERGNLTEEEVERFVDAELMLKGVLRVRELELVPEAPMPDPTTSVHVVVCGKGKYGEEFSIAFATREQAAAFIILRPFYVWDEYLNGEYVRVLEAAQASEIVERRHYDRATFDAGRAAIEKTTAAKAENAKRREAHAKAQLEQAKALKGLWEDWHSCRELVGRLQKVRATFEEYKRIAGDERTAAIFLAKVFTATEIEQALPYLRAPEAAE